MDENNKLKSEYEYYLEHKEEFLSKYNNKFIVIYNNKVHGSFKTMKDAIKFGMKNFNLGDFLVKQCSPSNDDQQTFHTRVGIFA